MSEMTDFAVQIEELTLGYDGNPALSAVSGSVHTGSPDSSSRAKRFR